MYSKRFYEMRDLHAKAHKEGVLRIFDEGDKRFAEGRKVFEGSEILHVVEEIKAMVDFYNSESIYDFGCGKANSYRMPFRYKGVTHRNMQDYLKIPKGNCYLYDPGVEKYSKEAPTGMKFDGVVCTDVLEHIPFEDVFTVLHDLFSRANHWFVATISTSPSYAHIGEDFSINAHCNVRPRTFWQSVLTEFAKHYKVAVYASIGAPKNPTILCTAPPNLVEKMKGL